MSAFTADVRFIGTGAVAHRKAALMIRQSLKPDSAYADAALHGDGLTSLQYRPAAAAATLEIEAGGQIGPDRARAPSHRTPRQYLHHARRKAR